MLWYTGVANCVIVSEALRVTVLLPFIFGLQYLFRLLCLRVYIADGDRSSCLWA